MDEAGRNHSDSSVNVGKSKLLRYPLRSATKLNQEKPPLPDSATKKTPSSVRQSTSVVDVSGGNNASKPIRRLSIPTKSITRSPSKSVGEITPPASRFTARRNINYNDGESITPMSDISKQSTQRKFKLLSSPSYWLSLIRHSETESKHSISLGFFNLALEAGCRDIPRLRDELKSYMRRYTLVEHQEKMNDLLNIYNISETMEQLQISAPSDDDAHDSLSLGTEEERPDSKENIFAQDSSKSSKQGKTQKNTPAHMMRGSSTKIPSNSKVDSDRKVKKAGSNSQKPIKQGMVKCKVAVENQEKNSPIEGSVNVSPAAENIAHGNKENLGATPELGLILSDDK